MEMKVITAGGESQDFDPDRIYNALLREAETDSEYARKVTNRIIYKVGQFEENGIEALTTTQIRNMVNTHLMNDFKFKEEAQHEEVGIPVADIKDLIQNHNTDNANMQRNPETAHKYTADFVLKKYALKCLPEHLRDAHVSGDLHIHDLEYFPFRPINCLQHDPRWFIRWGLMADGTGEHTSVAGSPKHATTYINHCGEVMLAGQQNCSGGQGMSLWNVFSAPMFEGMEFHEIERVIQAFVFNLNMAYSTRGGQVPFTSINLEFTVPDFLKNEVAYGKGGKEVGVYGDWEDETRQIQRAFTNVLMQGDAIGKPHLFPNTVYMLRKEMMNDEFYEDLLGVHELSAKFSTPYFASCIPEWTGVHSNVMGCRTRLNATWTEDWDLDCFRTGNLAYATINLPRLAYRSKDWIEFVQNLWEVLEKARDILMIRRNHALKLLNENKMLPFLSMKNPEGEQYYRIENATLSFGFGGMHECLLAMGVEDGLLSTEGQLLAKDILFEFNRYTYDLEKETGLRWTVLQTPGEACNHRFAQVDDFEFPNAVVNGPDGSMYYTNSSHVPVSNKVNVIERLKIESQFHPFTSGGNIFHLFMGESYSSAEALTNLTMKIAQKTDMGFWAYSGAMSYCFDCNFLSRGLQETCPNCKHSDNIEWYDRITGYVQQVGRKKDSAGGWNNGKRAELEDRYRYEV